MNQSRLPARRDARINGLRPRLVVILAFVLAAATGAAHAAQPAAAAQDVAYVTNERGGVDVIDLATLTVQRRIAVGGEGPRGLAVTGDGRYLLTANKATGDVSVLDTEAGSVVRRIPIGMNPEFVRIGGNVAYVTYEPAGSDNPAARGPAKEPAAAASGSTAAGAGTDRRADDKNAGDDSSARLALIDLATWTVTSSIRSGHETEGVEFSPDGRYLIVTNEGDNTVSIYDRRSGAPFRTVDTSAYGSRPRGIKATPDGKGYIVTLESSDKFLVLDSDYNPLQTVATRTGPYGIAFDPAGKRLFIAASRAAVLQVFDAASYAPLGEIAVGKRCWHFAFTPDGSKILAACGRSDAVYVVDARDFRTLKVLDGAQGPWGIVTYPKASGTLDTR